MSAVTMFLFSNFCIVFILVFWLNFVDTMVVNIDE